MPAPRHLTMRGRHPLRALVCCALVLLLGTTGSTLAQDYDRHNLVPMLHSDRAGVGAATLVCAGLTPGTGAVDQFGVLLAGRACREPYWKLHDPNAIQPLAAADLARVQDDAPLPQAIGEPTPTELAELRVYMDAVIAASETPDRTLVRLARHDLRFGDLYVDYASLRGQVVYVEGRLLRLRQVPAPQDVYNETGLTRLYEGWLATDQAKSDLVCVLFSELPPGLKPGERLDVPVSFAGYYFKRLGFTPRRGAPDTAAREAPLIIAHTVTVPPRLLGEENPADWVNGMLPLMIGFLVGVVGFIVVLAWWFSRGDARIRRRVALARRGEFVPPTPDVVPLALPVNQPVNRIAAYDPGDPNDPTGT